MAAPTVRALFVGVNHYAWTEKHLDDPLFKDLHGSVADIAMVKTAFATAYGLPVDTPPATGCEKPGGVSVTLLQECATGEAIMTAFAAALDASAKNDIVLFYFAGHGARFEDKDGVKPTGWNSSIMQSDARKVLSEKKYADIMGPELAVLINKASRRGVNVVTVFDSCNSGTASRALKTSAQVRLAPPPPAGEAMRVLVDPGLSGSGYIVHFAAAADGTPASEKPMDDGQVHGVFSWALSQILLKNSRAGLRTVSYQDIFDEIQRDVVTLGFPGQQPRSEGDLSQTFLGRNPISTQAVRVTAAPGGTLNLAAGSLSGVSIGSTYGLFASNTAAAASGAAPTAQATVTNVGSYSAQLSASPSGFSWARELQHKVALRSLRVQVQASEPMRTAIANVLKSLDLVQQVDDNPQFVILADNAGVHFLGADGSVAGEAGNPSSDQFADKITTAVKRVAEYEAVLALKDGATGTPPSISILPNGILPDSPDPTPHAVLTLGDQPSLSLTNTVAEPRYLYLLDLEPDYSITIIYPQRSGRNDAFPPNKMATPPSLVRADSLGHSQLLLLSTHTPIDVAAFRQDGVPRSIAGEPNALERLLTSAKTGKRDIEGPAVSDWGASMATVEVVAKTTKP
jgi:hypothetical protein